MNLLSSCLLNIYIHTYGKYSVLVYLQMGTLNVDV